MIVTFTDFDGNEQMGLVMQDDQKESLKQVKKSFVRLVNADHTPKLDANGKKLVSLKAWDKMKVIGFID